MIKIVKEKCGIYCIENLINKKKYIGQSKNIKNRWNEHKSLLKNNKHTNIHLQNSYNTYGKSNFKFYILENCDIYELPKKELFYIKKFNTTNRDLGYNLVASEQKGVDFNKEYLQKMREVQLSIPILQIDLSGNIIKQWDGGCRHASKELNFKFSSIWQCVKRNMYTYKDYIWIYADEYDQDKFDLQYYIKNRLKKRVIQLDKNLNYIKTWETIKDASTSLKIDTSAISKVCRHKSGYAGDFVWEYEFNYLEGNINPKKPKIDKSIVQIDSSGKLIKVWSKIAGVAPKIGYKDNGSIKKCCDGLINMAYGFKWMYKENYDKMLN